MNSYKEIPWPDYRNLIKDFLNLKKDLNSVYALFEVDITKISQVISERIKQGSKTNATIAYLLWCYGQAVKKHPEMQGMKKAKKLIIFDDVDISMQFERTLPDGRKVPVPHIFRSVQNKTYSDINEELQSLRNKEFPQINQRKDIVFLNSLPGFLRLFILRILMGNPKRFKQELGTVGFTTIGMAVRNRKFWPVPVGPHSCGIASGGTYKLKDSNGEKTFWCLTMRFDHNINDGAPGVRFGQTFMNMMESGEGLNGV